MEQQPRRQSTVREKKNHEPKKDTDIGALDEAAPMQHRILFIIRISLSFQRIVRSNPYNWRNEYSMEFLHLTTRTAWAASYENEYYSTYYDEIELRGFTSIRKVRNYD